MLRLALCALVGLAILAAAGGALERADGGTRHRTPARPAQATSNRLLLTARLAPAPAKDGPRILPFAPYGRAFRGMGFVAGERVTVTMSLGEQRTRVAVKAARDGRFVVRAAAGPGRCGDVFVRAVGARGSRATLELPRPACREP